MAEQRLIDANEAIEIAKEYYWVFERSRANLADLREVLKDCTTIEAKPVVHAHWNIVVDKGDPESFPEDLEYPQCSNPKCGKISMVKSEFCPHCGAQMDEKE